LVTWPVSQGGGDERPVARWLTLAAARKQQPTALSYSQFSSVSHMRAALSALPAG